MLIMVVCIVTVGMLSCFIATCCFVRICWLVFVSLCWFVGRRQLHCAGLLAHHLLGWLFHMCLLCFCRNFDTYVYSFDVTIWTFLGCFGYHNPLIWHHGATSSHVLDPGTLTNGLVGNILKTIIDFWWFWVSAGSPFWGLFINKCYFLRHCSESCSRHRFLMICCTSFHQILRFSNVVNMAKV